MNFNDDENFYIELLDIMNTTNAPIERIDMVTESKR